MSKFHLGLAEAGEPIEFRSSNIDRWRPAKFVGAFSNGSVAVECTEVNFHGVLHWPMTESCLRMAPKTVTVRYRNYKLCDAVNASVSTVADQPGYDSPEVIEKRSWFRGWIHDDWQEAEITE